MPISVGDTAPDFELVHRIGEPSVRLSKYRGEKPVVLLFFPLAFSSVCTDELCAVADDYSAWTDLNAEVIGVSVDSPFVNQRFAKECGAEFPVLSDFNTEASTAYGVRNDDFFGMKGVANRSAFVVDAEGTVRYAWVSEDAGILPDFDEIKGVVGSLA